MSAHVTVFASPQSWIESDALLQCDQVAALPGMLHVAGMPDLHPGKGAPIGAAMTSSVLYPFLVGSDIGCGIAVFPIHLKRVDPEKLAARFPDLDQPLNPADLDPADLDPADLDPADLDPADLDPADLGPREPGQFEPGPLGSGPRETRQVGMGPLGAGPFGFGPLGTGPLGTGLSRTGSLGAGSLGIGPSGTDPIGGAIPGGWTEGLGTVGRGNHFVELAKVDDLFDEQRASTHGLERGSLVLIVHSGSRGLGEHILRAHTELHGAGPAADPPAYLAAHNEAVRWGSLNRRLLAARVADAIGAARAEPIVDVCHNSVEFRDGTYLHRKGAAPGDDRDVLIAGTRGTHSYLVAAHAGPEAGYSVAHGAGRKMSRADALRRGKAKHTVDELRRPRKGAVVVCGDRQLLFEEAPTAYKRIDRVIADLVDHELVTPILNTLPVVTYKTREARRR